MQKEEGLNRKNNDIIFCSKSTGSQIHTLELEWKDSKIVIVGVTDSVSRVVIDHICGAS